MKTRPHKNNKRFTVTYQTRGHAIQKRSGISDSKTGFLNGTMFGIDRYNTQIFSITEQPL